MPFQLTEDGKINDTRVAYTQGYECCISCFNCMISHEGEITSEGLWKCLYHNRWYPGNALYEYNCDGYKMKYCLACKNYRKCQAEFRLSDDYARNGLKEPRYKWCLSFNRIDIEDPDIYKVGRYKPYHGKNQHVRDLEKRYRAMIKKEFEEIKRIGRLLDTRVRGRV